jgi:hypothetical protein
MGTEIVFNSSTNFIMLLIRSHFLILAPFSVATLPTVLVGLRMAGCPTKGASCKQAWSTRRIQVQPCKNFEYEK